MKKLLVVALLLGLPASAVARDLKFTTLSTEPLQWGKWYYLSSRSRCVEGPVPKVVVVKAPTKGSLEFVPTKRDLNEAKCKKTVSAVGFKYTPAPGITAKTTDKFSLLVRYETALPGDSVYEVTMDIVVPTKKK